MPRAIVLGGNGQVGSYSETVTAEIDWLVTAARTGDPAAVLPAPADPFFDGYFDYPREDAWLQGRGYSV